MTRILGKIAPLFFAALVTGIYSNQAQAQTEPNAIINQVEQYGQESQGNGIGQVTNVNQLRDVSPTDWAYEALRSLVDRYGCIAGFPNQTYRGNQALSRYEFAAGLNSCLNQIERLIASSEAVRQEDLETIRRLSQEFEAELATLGGRVDELESRTAFLEDNQFSTTTKLVGEAIFSLGANFSKNEEFNRETAEVFGYRSRLELETSFTGKDLLFTRLSTGNFPTFTETTGSIQGNFAFAEPADGELGLEVLIYALPAGDNTEILIGAEGLALDDIANTLNIFDGDGGSGAISVFGTRSPIFLAARPESLGELPGEPGVGIKHNFGDIVEFNAGYLSGEAADPSKDAGFFNGSYSAIGQLVFTPSESLGIGLTYRNGYNQSNSDTGSFLANIQTLTEAVFDEAVPTNSNEYGLNFSWDITDGIVLGGWGGLNKVRTLNDLDGQLPRGSQDLWNWAVTLGFPDVGSEGSLAGLIVGMEPWVTKSTIDAEGFGEDDKNSLHVEALYQWQINDNIGLTPGVIYINNPNNTENDGSLWLGTIRTTFTF